ncbi:MAG: hypothetical protein ACTMK5_20015, partial [Pseudomonas helleri]
GRAEGEQTQRGLCVHGSLVFYFYVRSGRTSSSTCQTSWRKLRQRCAEVKAPTGKKVHLFPIHSLKHLEMCRLEPRKKFLNL